MPSRSVARTLKQLRKARARASRRPAWRTAARAAYATSRFGIRHRKALAPLYAVTTQAAAGALLAAAPDGWKTALAIDAATAVSLLAWTRYDGLKLPGKKHTKHLRRRRPEAEAIAWASAAAGTACALITAMALTGGPAPGTPYPGILALWLAAFGIPWWRHHRKQPTGSQPLTERLQIWHDHVSPADGILPGAELIDPQTTGYGWTATIAGRRGRGGSWQRAAAAAGDIAATYDTDTAHLLIEKKPAPHGRHGNERLATLAVFETNPLQTPNPFTGPDVFDADTGRARIGLFYDGTPVHYQYWNNKSGAVHDFIIGTSDAGKSRLLDLLLSIERASPLMVSWVADPQHGASLPEWMEAVDWFAPSAERGHALLKAAHRVMKERERRYSRMTWTDEKGRTRRGRGFFVPGAPDPLLVVTIDECPDVLKRKGAAAMAAEIAREARKCGIKLRLVSQTPWVDQLGAAGASSTLRSILQAGNIIALRTGAGADGKVALGGQMQVDTSALPKYWPDGSPTGGLGFISGPDQRAGMFRVAFVEDPVHWTTIGGIDHLEQGSCRAAGEDYAGRLEVMAAHLRGEDIDAQADTEADTEQGAEAQQTEPEEDTARTGERILAHLAERGAPAARGVIADALGVSLDAAAMALTRLKKKDRVISLGSGIWAHPDHAEALPEPADPDMDEAVA